MHDSPNIQGGGQAHCYVFKKKSLQSSPLKVSVDSGSLNILQKNCSEREIRESSWSCIILWLGMYFSTHHATNPLHSKTSGTHPTQVIPDAQITFFYAGGEE
jgi:hypothetical protein